LLVVMLALWFTLLLLLPLGMFLLNPEAV